MVFLVSLFFLQILVEVLHQINISPLTILNIKTLEKTFLVVTQYLIINSCFILKIFDDMQNIQNLPTQAFCIISVNVKLLEDIEVLGKYNFQRLNKNLFKPM